jgi:hypothetical protein
LPPVAPPLPIEIDPLVPEDDVPELKLSTPLTPLAPAFALRMMIAPLVVAVPLPVVNATYPPVPKTVYGVSMICKAVYSLSMICKAVYSA